MTADNGLFPRVSGVDLGWSDADSTLDVTISDLPSPAVDSRANAMRRRRNRFFIYPPPSRPMSSRRDFPDTSNSGQTLDDLEALAEWFEDQPDGRDRFRWALRDSLDELMDGQRTGRWCYQHLSKTEKTYLGTAVEINLTKEFAVPQGNDLDWQIGNVELDCKFSKDLGGWEIPMEMYECADHGDRSGAANHPALLVWFDDDRGLWAAGLLRMTDDLLRWKQAPDHGEVMVRAYNRDNKRRLGFAALPLIRWLWGGLHRDLPSNLLLHMDSDARNRIFSTAAVSDGGLTSGQKRIDQLFREVQGRICGRQTVLTVGQQDDAPKRARDARDRLRDEGYLVLGHQESHPEIARRLRLTVPVKGEWISVRVVSISAHESRPKVYVRGRWWAVALPHEPIGPAPMLPRGRLEWQPDGVNPEPGRMASEVYDSK